MDFHAFAARVKEKYPEYANVDDLTLAQKVVSKYPEYRSNIDQGDLTAMDNLSGLNGQGPISELSGAAETAGRPVKAGISGIADLAAGNGLQQAATDVQNVENGQAPETTAGKVGSAVGSLVTPAQIALQGGIGAFLEASGMGPWIVDKLQGWAGDAAQMAVGKIKNLAKALGINNMDALGQFLLSPIRLGSKTFDPIVTATSSPEDMLSAAEAIQKAAGKQLGTVSSAVDDAINETANAGGEAMKENGIAIDLADLQKKLAVLKEEAVGDIPKLGARVAAQFDAAIDDLNEFIKGQLSGPTDTTFSDLSAIKTKIGNLVFKHGSPLESKAALNDVYHAISDTLSDATSKVGGEAGAAYDQANEIYHQVSAVIEGLEGRAVNAKQWFDMGSIAGGVTAAMATHNPILAAPAFIAGNLATKAVENYAPQAIAAGLNTVAPYVGPAVSAGVRAIPAMGNVIASALGQ